MGHGLGSDSDSTLSPAPSPPCSRPSSPAPVIPVAATAPPPFARASRRKSIPGPGASSTSTTLPKAAKTTSKTPKATTSSKATPVSPKPTPTPSLPKKRTYQQRKRSIQLQKAPTSEETPASTEDEQERRKPRKRRAQPKAKADPTTATATSSNSNPAVDPTPTTSAPKRGKGKAAHRSRASTSKIPAPVLQSSPGLEAAPLATLKKVETRPPSFLTKAVLPIPGIKVSNGKPRADVWSYAELDGLVWVRLDLGNESQEEVKIAGDDQKEGILCWWPGEVTDRTPNCLKLSFCGAPPNVTATSTSLELLPSSLSESNILTFRSTSSVRFSTFATAYSTQPPPEDNTEAEASLDEKLEAAWKTACTRAFEIDTETNDGLEDIFLLFSQKTRSERDESTQGSVVDPVEVTDADDGYKTDEADVLETDMVVLCRYYTRYYPAKVCKYYPRGEKGPSGKYMSRGKYMCRFADDTTRVAARHEIHTQLDPGFATCPLGHYTQKASTYTGQSWVGRPPTPEPRASSPEPPEVETTIDTAEYCALERMRDQLRPVLPFLQGIISRTYTPGRGAGTTTEEAEELLDRHAAYMQGGRARRSLAYSVHMGDLNEDDCEALLYEVSRWALRGERWAGRARSVAEVGLSEGRVTDTESAAVVDVVTTTGTVSPVDTVGPSVADTIEAGPPAVENVAPQTVKDTDSQDMKMAVDSEPAVTNTIPVIQVTEYVEENDVEMEVEVENTTSAGSNGKAAEDEDTRSDNCSTPDTVAENLADKTIVQEEYTPDNTHFHELIKQQPPRPTGGPEYEQLAPGERMGYVSDVLYPEAAALILSYRRGIRTHVGPVPDAQAEFELYKAGLRAAKNTMGQEDWVDKVLATRQLREAATNKYVPSEDSEQVVVSGGTRSRPKFMPSKSMLK